MNAEIIIVTYGQPKIEARCVESVRKYTDLKKHILTVVDNFVRDKNLAALWNELIEKSRAEFICLLNSDTIVEPDWIENLMKCAAEHGADAVGPMTNHCGIGYQVGQKHVGHRRVDQLSGFCLLLRRSAWLAAGGFREDAPFYGQESNLLRRLRHKLLCGGVFVHHEAGASVRASGRAEEERALSRYWWPRNTEFNWKNRLAILGAPDSPFPLWAGINQAVREFRREGMRARHFDCTTVTEQDLREFNPTVIILVSQRWPVIAACAEMLGSFTVPRACWFNDLRNAEKGAGTLRGFDRAFLCFRDSPKYSWRDWERLSGVKMSYMPQGSVISTELKPFKSVHRLVFIGGHTHPEFHGGRRDAIYQLRAHAKNEFERSKRIQIEKESQTLYRRSKFVLSMSPPVPGYSSIRLYNIMAYGGLALVADFPGLEKMFVSGKHILTWKNLEQAENLMNAWGTRDGECEIVRRRAWRLQQAKHTVSARLMNMVANMTTGDQTFWGEAS